MRPRKESSHKNLNTERKTTGEELRALEEELHVVQDLSEQMILHKASPLHKFFSNKFMPSRLIHLNECEQKIKSEIAEKQNTLGLKSESLIKNLEGLEKVPHMPGKYSHLVRRLLTKWEYDDKQMEEVSKKMQKSCELDFESDINIEPGHKPRLG